MSSSEKIIFELFNVLRGSLMSSEVLLLLWVLYKKGGYDSVFYFHPDYGSLDTILKSIGALSEEENDTLESCFEYFSNEILLINNQQAELIKSQFEEVNGEVSIGEFFDEILFQIVRNRSFELGEHILPNEISELIVNLAEFQNDDSVFNPFAGYASFALKTGANVKYIGQEKNISTIILADLRLWAHDKLKNVEISNSDTILNWPASQKFDKIIASVPFGLKIPRNKYPMIESREIEEYFLSSALDSISNKGKVVAHISNKFLSSGGRAKKIREKFISEGWVEGIIHFPSNLMYNTNISSSIIILSKYRSAKHPIKFLDASELFNQVNRKTRILDYKLVTDIYNQIEKSKNLRMVDFKEIKKNDYNFIVTRYFLSKIKKNIYSVQLKDILQPTDKKTFRKKGREVDGKNSKQSIVNLASLNNEDEGIFLDKDKLQKVDLNKEVPIYSISKESLLIARIGIGLMPTIFKKPVNDVMIDARIDAFTFTKGKVDPGYLVFELRKDYVTKQIGMLKGGNTLNLINQNDFMSIEIALPSIDKQRQSVLDTINLKAQENVQKFTEGLTDLKLDYYRKFQQTRHSVRNLLLNVSTGLIVLKDFMKKKDGKVFDITEKPSAKAMQSVIEQIQGMLESTKEASKRMDLLEIPFLDSSKKAHSLLDLVTKNFIKYDNEECKITTVFDEESFLFDGNNFEPIILINEADFHTIYGNIVQNAIDHGFKGKSDNYILNSIYYYPQIDKVILEVSNNGHPFPEGFTETHFKLRGESTKRNQHGTLVGNGGADINELTKVNGAEFTLILDDESDLPVNYVFQFDLAREGV